MTQTVAIERLAQIGIRVRDMGLLAPRIDIFHLTDSIDDTYTLITRELIEHSIAIPGPVL